MNTEQLKARADDVLSAPHYGERDAIAQGQDYFTHVNAMTAEGLHSKAAIAAELAHRDTLIRDMLAHIEQLERAAEQQEAVRKDVAERVAATADTFHIGCAIQAQDVRTIRSRITAILASNRAKGE